MDGPSRRPTDSSLREGTPSPGEVPSGVARALWLLWGFSKVTRRKGGTHTSPNPNTGHVPRTPDTSPNTFPQNVKRRPKAPFCLPHRPKRSNAQYRVLHQGEQRLWVHTQEEGEQGDRQQHHATGFLFPVQLSVHTAQVWLDQVQGDHHTQVVEHADGATQHEGGNQPPFVSLNTRSNDVELTGKA